MSDPLQKNPLLQWLLTGAKGEKPTDRAEIYARLVRSNLSNVIEEAFPVTREMLTETVD